VSTVKCPFCAEVIQQEALLCRYCGKRLSEKPRSNRQRNVLATLLIASMVVIGMLWFSESKQLTEEPKDENTDLSALSVNIKLDDMNPVSMGMGTVVEAPATGPILHASCSGEVNGFLNEFFMDDSGFPKGRDLAVGSIEMIALPDLTLLSGSGEVLGVAKDGRNDSAMEKILKHWNNGNTETCSIEIVFEGLAIDNSPVQVDLRPLGMELKTYNFDEISDGTVDVVASKGIYVSE
jgi:predicted nucleic acid-binding Zn ribbon protein